MSHEELANHTISNAHSTPHMIRMARVEVTNTTVSHDELTGATLVHAELCELHVD